MKIIIVIFTCLSKKKKIPKIPTSFNNPERQCK